MPLASVKTWTPRRQELYEWFVRQAPSLAEAYKGAVYLVAQRQFPARVHFIAHAVRDIADRLPFVLDGELESDRVPYECVFDTILGTLNEGPRDRHLNRWPSEKELADGDVAQTTAAENHNAVLIPRNVYQELDKLMQHHRRRRDQPKRSALLFRALLRIDPRSSAASKRLVRAFDHECKWFMKKAHLPREPFSAVSDSELERRFERFETMLHSFVGRFFTQTRELDEILRQANSTTD